jgi:hypothetical protein
MPHYADGIEAQLGDVVQGKPYNTPHEVTGVVVDIRAGDSCNLDVAFARKPASNYQPRVLAVCTGSQQTPQLVELATDAGETQAFKLLHRA